MYGHQSIDGIVTSCHLTKYNRQIIEQLFKDVKPGKMPLPQQEIHLSQQGIYLF
jgi:hypothetical protein